MFNPVNNSQTNRGITMAIQLDRVGNLTISSSTNRPQFYQSLQGVNNSTISFSVTSAAAMSSGKGASTLGAASANNPTLLTQS
ncbi:MAG TPA: hypothetical protein ACHBX0_07780 [Arsenophonus sp.]